MRPLDVSLPWFHTETIERLSVKDVKYIWYKISFYWLMASGRTKANYLWDLNFQVSKPTAKTLFSSKSIWKLMLQYFQLSLKQKKFNLKVLLLSNVVKIGIDHKSKGSDQIGSWIMRFFRCLSVREIFKNWKSNR